MSACNLQTHGTHMWRVEQYCLGVIADGSFELLQVKAETTLVVRFEWHIFALAASQL